MMFCGRTIPLLQKAGQQLILLSMQYYETRNSCYEHRNAYSLRVRESGEEKTPDFVTSEHLYSRPDDRVVENVDPEELSFKGLISPEKYEEEKVQKFSGRFIKLSRMQRSAQNREGIRVGEGDRPGKALSRPSVAAPGAE